MYNIDMMELIPYIISSSILMLSIYMLIKRKASTWIIVMMVAVPITINSIDLFVPGNLTVLRQAFYSLYALVVLLISLKGRL